MPVHFRIGFWHSHEHDAAEQATAPLDASYVNRGRIAENGAVEGACGLTGKSQHGTQKAGGGFKSHNEWTQTAAHTWQKKRVSSGTFALQAHDPGSIVRIKSMKVKALP